MANDKSSYTEDPDNSDTVNFNLSTPPPLEKLPNVLRPWLEAFNPPAMDGTVLDDVCTHAAPITGMDASV
jgi:hypothetical protein